MARVLKVAFGLMEPMFSLIWRYESRNRPLKMCYRRDIRHTLSESGPATADPTTDPAASAEQIAPWTTPAGELKYVRYCFCTTIADMDEISKTKLESC
jgi:hypothetical protein